MKSSNTNLGKFTRKILPNKLFLLLRDRFYTPLRIFLQEGNWRIPFDIERIKIRKFVIDNFNHDISTIQVGNYCLPKSVIEDLLLEENKINIFSLGLATNFEFDKEIKSIFGNKAKILGFDPSKFSCEAAISENIFDTVVQAGVVSDSKESNKKMKLFNSQLVDNNKIDFETAEDVSNSNKVKLINVRESLSYLNGEDLNILKIDIESNTINVLKSFLEESKPPDLLVAEIENRIFGSLSQKNPNYLSDLKIFFDYLYSKGYSEISTIKRREFKYINVEIFAFKS